MSIALLRPVASAWRRLIIGSMCVLALGFGTGCSSLRLGYNQGPTLAYWWLDRYVDFDETQAPRVREALADGFAWHRRTQLPGYVALLTRLEAEVLADTTPERACEWWAELLRRSEPLSDQAIPAAAELAASLSTAQIEQIEKRYADTNDDYRDDYMQADAGRRLKASVKRVVERTENLYGRLDDAQRAQIAALTAESPFDAELIGVERQRRQQDTVQMLRRIVADGADRAAAQSSLRSYFAGLRHSPREDYRRYVDRLRQYNCRFAASVHNGTSPAQRQVALQKLKGWKADLVALSADAS